MTVQRLLLRTATVLGAVTFLGAIHAAPARPVITAAVTATSGVCPSIPTAQSTFLSGAEVWFDFTYNGGSDGDQYQIQWVLPNGSIDTTFSYTQSGTGSYCYNYSIITPSGVTGAYTVNLIWNGTTIDSVAFTVGPPCTSFGVASGTAQNWLIDGSGTTTGWGFVTTPANCAWTATGSSGITSISQAAGVGAGNITATYNVNNSSVVQVDTVTLSSGSTTFVLYVTINPKACSFSPSPASLSFPSTAGSKTLAVTSSLSVCEWFAQTNASWLHVTPPSLLIGSQSLTISVDANAGPARSAATNSYGAYQADYSVQVTQSQPTDNLSVSPPSVSLSNGSGSGTVSTAATLNNTGNGATNFTTSSNASWLSVAPASGNIAAGGSVPLTVFANTSNLLPGSYSGTVTFTGAFSTATLGVSLTVNGVSISASPNPLNLGTIQPQKQPPNTITVTSTGGQAVVSVGAASNPSWLTLSTNQITASPVASFTITVNATSLSPGPYFGTVTLQCTAAPCIEVQLPVTFTVAGVDYLTANPPSVPLSQGSGGGNVTGTSMLGNTGNASTNFTISTATNSGGLWLSASSPSTSIAPGGSATINITATAAFLAPGSYNGTVTVTGTTSKALIAVAFSVSGVSLTVSPNPINLGSIKAAPQGGVAVKVTSTGNATVAVSGAISPGYGTGWLSNDSSGPIAVNTTATFHVTVDATSLKPGPYLGMITFQCTAAPCMQVQVPVQFTVQGATSLVCATASLMFSDYMGWTAPLTQTFSVATTDGTPIPISFSPPPSWLQISPASGNAGASQTSFTATASLSALPAGVTNGSFTVQAGNLTSSCPLSVSANITALTLTANPNPMVFTLSGAASESLPLFIGSTNSQSVSVMVTTTGDSAGNWLSAAGTITAPQSLNVTANAGNSGSRAGSVTLACASGTPCQSLTVPVTAHVTQSPILVAQPPGVNFTPPAGGGLPQAQTVQIASSDNATAIPFTVNVTSTGNWLKAAASPSTSPSTLTVSMTSLPAQNSSGTVTLAASNGSPSLVINVNYTAPSATPPAIADVENGASFQPGLTPGSYFTIKGTNLTTGETERWDNYVIGNQLPTGFDNVSVSVAGMPAYPYYISPSQINAIAPSAGYGPVSVTVTTADGSSSSFSVMSGEVAPAFFLWPNSQPVATHWPDYTWAVKNATFSVPTVPAKPGDIIILWGTGFGPTNPAVPDGVTVPSNQAYSLPTLPVIVLNNQPCMVLGASLTPNSAGLYQITLQVPANMANGDWPIVTILNGVSSPSGVLLTVHN